MGRAVRPRRSRLTDIVRRPPSGQKDSQTNVLPVRVSGKALRSARCRSINRLRTAGRMLKTTAGNCSLRSFPRRKSDFRAENLSDYCASGTKVVRTATENSAQDDEMPSEKLLKSRLRTAFFVQTERRRPPECPVKKTAFSPSGRRRPPADAQHFLSGPTNRKPTGRPAFLLPFPHRRNTGVFAGLFPDGPEQAIPEPSRLTH